MYAKLQLFLSYSIFINFLIPSCGWLTVLSDLKQQGN